MDTIHGYPILEQKVVKHIKDETFRIILVDRQSQYERYVTAYHRVGADEWTWGHYFNSLDNALRDYHERVKRGY